LIGEEAHSDESQMRSFIITVARIAAWLLTIVIIVLSLVPPSLRPETAVPHNFEHFSIFFASGVAFGVGYSRRVYLMSVMLVIFAGAIELAQIVVPGRHARFNDFIVDALAACIGAAITSLIVAGTLE
jgi:VanZ family protein